MHAEAQNRPSLAQEFKAARPTCLGVWWKGRRFLPPNHRYLDFNGKSLDGIGENIGHRAVGVDDLVFEPFSQAIFERVPHERASPRACTSVGLHLTGLHLTGRVPHGLASHRLASHWACILWTWTS